MICNQIYNIFKMQDSKTSKDQIDLLNRVANVAAFCGLQITPKSASILLNHNIVSAVKQINDEITSNPNMTINDLENLSNNIKHIFNSKKSN